MSLQRLDWLPVWLVSSRESTLRIVVETTTEMALSEHNHAYLIPACSAFGGEAFISAE